jgi:eukaryotic-like serine/threonine-protein kinase
MRISSGSRLGPYDVLSPLGAGGMGEIWKARDTRLGREVAIKVLPAALSSDSDRLRRFEKEARAASALNHPSIVTIHEVDRVDSTTFIVMELVEGKTLREVMAIGALPTRRLLDLAVQIADGLARAHASGIVHRDLKPENVMVTKEGLVKVLDFGLAKLVHPESDAGQPAEASTVSEGTTPGAVMGTVGYMSPEQASGHPVDVRSDQFSFGSMLYEMTTGKQPFRRATAAQTMAAIIQDEPDAVGRLNPKAPSPLCWIIERCLAKEPAERYDSTRDLARELATCRSRLQEMTSGAASPSAAVRVTRRRVVLGGAAAAALALTFLGGRKMAPEGISPGGVSFQRLTFRRGNVLQARFAPDGRTVVYSAAWDDKSTELFSVRTDSRESRPLGIPNADILSISSKGELAILIKKAFRNSTVGDGTLARVPLGGGAPREIAENACCADWSPDGSELALIAEHSPGKSRIEYPVGKTFYRTASYLDSVRVSPKGDLVAFEEFDGTGGFVVVADSGGKVRKIAGPWGYIAYLSWRPDGRSVVFSAGLTPTRDVAIYEAFVTGKQRVLYPPGEMLTVHDLLPDGRLLVEREIYRFEMVVRRPGDEREREMSWLDGSSAPILSADGSTVAFSEVGEGGGPKGSVFLRRIGADSAIRLGDGLVWSLSPDGKWALSFVPGPPHELMLLATGAGETRKIALSGLRVAGGSFLADGGTLVVIASEADKPYGLWTLPIEGGKPHLVLPEYPIGNTSDIWGFVASPDGKKLAVHPGGGKAFILPLDGGPRTPLAGVEPEDEFLRWSGDGRYLFVSSSKQMPAKIFSRIEIGTGKRELWRTLMPAVPSGVVAIGAGAISPDGQTYAYSYPRVIASDLYLLAGLQ